jgi:glycosyltransferase involved in cell wall biosynthesis
MNFTVLSVAYPFARVGPDAVGGAEQILAHLDRALVETGNESLVVACQRSQTAGQLWAVPEAAGLLTEAVRAAIYDQVRKAVGEILATCHIDLVHMHGVDFTQYLPPPGVPVLVTLHLPPSWYPPEVFQLGRPKTFLHCVSAAQRRACPESPLLIHEVENGVPVERLGSQRHAKRTFAIALGRICPEKGFHFALSAAAQADTPMLLAGEVFKYASHQEYFRKEIVPRLDKARRFIGPIGFCRKRRLLGAARCLLVPSLVAETSSLVAMEALACGTPVIAFPSGALVEILEHGKTGFLVRDEREMSEAIKAVDSLSPEDCRAAARARFGIDRMVRAYFGVYERSCVTSCSR